MTVTEVTKNLKRCLNDFFPDVWVKGEVVSFNPHRSGHWYFQIKDNRSLLSCTMFRGRNQRMTWKPQAGDQLLLKGGLEIYPPQGKYSLNVREMEPLGEGIFKKRIEALKRKLKAEGLLDPARKRPLPAMPRRIGVATSGSGAAFHDIRKVIDERFPNVTLYLAPCRVQGQGAAAEIARAIQMLNHHGKSQVIIVGRGGGSKEDLMAFNEEIVARAIAASTIPVVSAVGHQIDESVSDLVADAFAATPSHAAEMIVPDRAQLLRQIEVSAQRLQRSIGRDLDARRQIVRRLHLQTGNGARREINRSREMVKRLQGRSVEGMRRELKRWTDRLAQISLRNPADKLKEGRKRCDELENNLKRAMGWDLTVRKQKLSLLMGKLDALSPLSVLSRGYSLTLKDGRAVRDAAELSVGDAVEIRFAAGRVTATIEEA
ncbi:MAG: exodeoxyribonuclease VII large subunit [Myxococcota bacterium]